MEEMRTIDPKSWRMWSLFCILLVIAVVPVVIPLDHLIFACKIRCGSTEARQECFKQLYAGNAIPHPWWTFSCLLHDKDPLTRIGAAKLRYSIARTIHAFLRF